MKKIISKFIRHFLVNLGQFKYEIPLKYQKKKDIVWGYVLCEVVSSNAL